LVSDLLRDPTPKLLLTTTTTTTSAGSSAAAAAEEEEGQWIKSGPITTNNEEEEEEDEADCIPLQLQRLFGLLQLSGQGSVGTENLTKSFGWSTSDGYQQHDVQVRGGEGGIGGGVVGGRVSVSMYMWMDGWMDVMAPPLAHACT
jgi:hypothetical protein